MAARGRRGLRDVEFRVLDGRLCVFGVLSSDSSELVEEDWNWNENARNEPKQRASPVDLQVLEQR